MVASVVFLVIMSGGLQYYSLSNSILVRQKLRRLAIAAASARMETLAALDYDQATADSNETGKPINIGSKPATRTTTITTVDDAADGLAGADADANTADYKSVSVQVAWSDGRSQAISMVSRMADITYGSADSSTSSTSSTSSSWGRKCELVIQARQVPGTVTDFPVLLTRDTLPLEMFDADGSYPASNGGGDLKFTLDAAGSTRIPCDVVTFATDNRPTRGQAEVWVKVPSISNRTNTSIWVWYYNPGQTQPAGSETYGSQAVWSNGFVMVQHMNQNPSAASPQMIDATGNGHNGASAGSMKSNDLVVGAIGQGIDFDGSNDRITVPYASTLNPAQFTVSMWAKVEGGRDYRSPLTSRDEASFRGFNLYSATRRNEWQFWHGTGRRGWYWMLGDRARRRFEHLVVSFDGSTRKIYDEGDVDNARRGTFAANTVSDMHIGAGNSAYYFNGKIDEVRIANTARSDNWVETEYNNQKSSATFVIEGTPQTP